MMDEINIKDFLSYFKEKLTLVLLIILMTTVCGTLYMTLILKPKYESYTTILLTKSSDDNTSITQNDINLNQKLVTTYREIIKSRLVLNQVITNLDLKYDLEELDKMITVSSVNDTEIIKISVESLDKEEAMKIANNLADVFTEEITNRLNIENISVIDVAEESNEPSNISPIKNEVIYVGAGVVLSLLLTFIMYYFDNSIQSVDDIENKLGIPVIGTVPMRKPRGKKAKK